VQVPQFVKEWEKRFGFCEDRCFAVEDIADKDDFMGYDAYI